MDYEIKLIDIENKCDYANTTFRASTQTQLLNNRSLKSGYYICQINDLNDHLNICSISLRPPDRLGNFMWQLSPIELGDIIAENVFYAFKYPSFIFAKGSNGHNKYDDHLRSFL